MNASAPSPCKWGTPEGVSTLPLTPQVEYSEGVSTLSLTPQVRYP